MENRRQLTLKPIDYSHLQTYDDSSKPLLTRHHQRDHYENYAF